MEDSQAQQHSPDHTESKSSKNAVDHKVSNMTESVFELDATKRNSDPTTKDDQVESFSESPGAVLVNLLTSLRHFPVGMQKIDTSFSCSFLTSISDWMRIGAFCFDSSDAFPVDNLIRPTKFPKEKKVQNMLNFCGSCVLQNIKSGIWITACSVPCL